MNEEVSDVDRQPTLGALAGMTSEMLTSIPAPIQQTALAVFRRLAIAAAELPTAYLEGKAGEIKEMFRVKNELMSVTGQKIADSLEVPHEYVVAAMEKAVAKVVGKQLNVDKVCAHAADDLSSPQPFSQPVTGKKQISENWLNAFEQEASNMTEEHMQLLFGKILAGEIRKPSSFSIRTLRVMAELDGETAEFFSRAASLALQFSFGDTTECWLALLGRDVKHQPLQTFGLKFGRIQALADARLLLPETRSYLDFTQVVAEHPDTVTTLSYCGRSYELRPNRDTPSLVIQGFSFAGAGEEIYQVVTKEENLAYTSQLVGFIQRSGYDMVEISEWASGISPGK